MKTKIVTFLVHLTVWVIFLSLPYIFRPKPMMEAGMIMPSQTDIFLRGMVFNIYLIGVFYLHGFWMMPKLFFKKHWIYYSGLLIVLLVVFMTIRGMLFVRPRPMGPPPNDKFELFRPELIDSIVLFGVIIIISGGIWIVQEWKRIEKRNKQIEAERMVMELSLLKSQINPHFLFNTLNSIYSLALMKSDRTPDAVMKLSDIMWYMTEDSNSDRVLLSKEADYIRHYVELQKIRLGDNVRINMDFSGNLDGYEIPPLILMPFVENAFKYGISTREPTDIRISLTIEDQLLKFKVSNPIVREQDSPVTSGLGIRNTRQRLERIYTGRYTLEITDDHKFFIIQLKILLG